MSTNNTQPPLRVGVMFEDVQYADLACVDILGNLSTKIASGFSSFGAAFDHFIPQSRPMEFLYVSSTLDPACMIPGIRALPTHTYDTAPRNLDLLVIGGTSPKGHPESSLKYLREAVRETRVVIGVCTGGLWLAAAGVLEDKKATTNRIALRVAREMYPSVEWVDQR
ncbi:hypothetical protein GQ43DRAFT_436564 [Delitschia confertaspora ATCC 74209]|uniref:DJ-1/PfpI domain-containing protein n=1 Tax=Delitschia confertaspora ATCC 74209 TaxID=1513339 RepID=A0A9P4JX55_9PLEO|nr:hypothetical protein GQ43DRAFT_436564 [Delitschia confertaspora ATCC 74209]